MRVLYVHGKGELAGADFSLLSILRSLDRSKVVPYLAVGRRGPLFDTYTQLCEAAVEVDTAAVKSPESSVELASLLAAQFPAIIRLYRLIKQWRIEIVHVNCIVIPSALVAARLAGIPCIVHKREIITSHPAVANVLDMLAAACINRAIAVSKETLNASNVLLRRKGTVIYNGVALDGIATEGGQSQLPFLQTVPLGAPRIAMFSRIEPWKGQDVALEAFQRVLRDFPEARLFFFGKPYTKRGEKYMQELHQTVRDSQIEARVVFAGAVSSVANAYAEFDIVLLPSVEPEPFSRVAIEAMAASRPVIATAVGGNMESVADGETGIIVPPRDSMKLADAILNLLSNEQRRRQMGLAGRERAAVMFDIRNTVRKIEELYCTVANQALPHVVTGTNHIS